MTVGAMSLNSCELLENASSSGLSSDEIVEGLKTALVVGTDTSVTVTSAVNGYFKDEAIQILLPDEADPILEVLNNNYVSDITAAASKLGMTSANVNLQGLVDNVVLSMNRAAEAAAKQAAPIFKSSITSLSITDGLSILNGANPADTSRKKAAAFDSTAATNYLISTTQPQLVSLYSPKIDSVLDIRLSGLSFSTNEAWSTLISGYSQLVTAAQSMLSANQALGAFGVLSSSQKTALQKFTPITTTSLGTYVTDRALDGLFLKVGVQEKSIRKDPWKWISTTVGNILTKVFGS
jgi:hypothetical protein